MIKLSYTDRTYSPSKFMKYIEHRVRKDIRLNKPIKPRDTVYVLNDGSKEFHVAMHFLKNVFGENLTVKETKKRVKGKLVIPTNMERYLSLNLQYFLEKTYKESNEILILNNVLEEEIIEICKILKIKAKKEEKVHELIEGMEDRYPGSKFSLYKSFQQLFSHPVEQ